MFPWQCGVPFYEFGDIDLGSQGCPLEPFLKFAG
jgi:hypothetical protein